MKSLTVKHIIAEYLCFLSSEMKKKMTKGIEKVHA